MGKLTKKQIKVIEDLGWCVSHNESNYICVCNYSPADEDMVIECDDVKDLISCCENFDPEEHFNVWYGANRGEPQHPGRLWEDCLAEEEMYSELADALKKTLK